MTVHSEQVIELSLVVTVDSEAQAAAVAEILARNMIALSDDDATVSLSVDRYDRVCHHHDEEEVEP